VQDNNGNFYGAGDGNEGATVFDVTASGTLTTLTTLANPAAGSLVQGSDGNFYGTTAYDGAPGVSTYGTIFKVTPSGTLTTLYDFTSVTAGTDDGSFFTMVQGSDGNFYGVTSAGGTASGGSIFAITPSGTFNTVYNFCSQTNCTDGEEPSSSLVEGSDGNFYGTTYSGGAFGGGTVFKVTTLGTLTTLYSFCIAGESDGCYDYFPPGSYGYHPRGLMLASDGNFYGTSYDGGLLKITPAGTVTALTCSHASCLGFYPPSLQGSDGNFYGIGLDGGANNGSECDNVGCGSVFKIAVSPALAPPIQVTLPDSSISAPASVTLTWAASNAFSTTMQLCALFSATDYTTTALGPLTGTLVDGVFGGTATVTPAADGVYTYGVTCGGVETGIAFLRVGGGKAATATSLQATSPVTLGSAVTLTATPSTAQNIAAMSGSVTFSVGSASIGSVPLTNGAATLNFTAQGIPTGTYPVTATYSGDTNYLSSSTTTNVVVLGYVTAATLTTSSTKLAQGQSATLTSTVTRTGASGNPTGSVTFYAGTIAIGTVKLVNGTATLIEATSGIVPPGTYAITANYAGDASDQAAASTAVVDVTVIAATGTKLTVSQNPIPADSTVTLTATVKQTYDAAVPTGTVAFSVGGDVLGTETLGGNGVATLNESDFNIPAGTYPLTATYSGDANNAASSTTVNVVVQ
jgi:uncharacterized repeat protein (TIGR03803 family)